MHVEARNTETFHRPIYHIFAKQGQISELPGISDLFKWLFNHLAQDNDSLFVFFGKVEYFSLLAVHDCELQQCIFSQIRIRGSESADLHTRCCKL